MLKISRLDEQLRIYIDKSLFRSEPTLSDWLSIQGQLRSNLKTVDWRYENTLKKFFDMFIENVLKSNSARSRKPDSE